MMEGPEDREERFVLQVMAALIASGMVTRNTAVRDRDVIAEVSVAIAKEIRLEVIVEVTR